MKIIFMLFVLLVACSRVPSKERRITYSEKVQAVADLYSVKWETFKGVVTFEDMEHEIRVVAEFSGLPPQTSLGFHIHEQGICEGPKYETAGGHFNPHGKDHGAPEQLDRHLGDLGNLETDINGSVQKTILLPKSEPSDFRLLIGKSILVHAKRDDLKTQPSGNSGDRMACGLINPVNEL